MKRTPLSQFPRLRADGLVIHELPDEVLVYDKIRDQAHCLNQSAALVWRACDGQCAPSDIARKLNTQLAVAVPEDLVLLALVQLEEIHLLEQQESTAPSFAGMSRRQMARSLGLAAAVALPVITSILVPTPAQAATCLAPGQPCSPVTLCCTSCNPTAPGGPKCI
ncbi:MAG TPA: PqqD family protein [Pyrinomonadaceae bacterium]|nr:PqqD family protein [Pyrinomonadaceae bacterium]